MNPPPLALYQTIGNGCVGVAALLYAVPLQIVLWEFAHKRNDSAGGAFAGLLIVIPLWLLCVTASGGFEWVRVLCAIVSDVPAPNYTTKQRMKELRNWGTKMFDVLPKTFASTKVDFTEVKADFEDKVNPR